MNGMFGGVFRDKFTGSIFYPVAVNTVPDLPDPTLHTGELYYVKTSIGIPFVNRKPKGLYYSDGVFWDWAGELEYIFSDVNFQIYNQSDSTKKFKIDVSYVGAGQTRKLIPPNGDINFNGGVDGQVMTQQADGSFQPETIPPTTPTAHASTHVNGTDDIQDATAGQKGLATASQIAKLNGIANGATANSSDAFLLARGNHTGTQLAITISNFDAQVSASTTFAVLPGRAGGQTLNGGTGAGDNLLLASTTNATKGKIALGSLTTGLIWDDVNSRFAIGTASSTEKNHLFSTTAVTLASTAHPLTIGDLATGLNLALGGSIIQARNNGATADLQINPLGGNIAIGQASANGYKLLINGNTNINGYADLMGAGGNDLRIEPNSECDFTYTVPTGVATWDFRSVILDGTSNADYRFGISSGSTGSNAISLFMPNSGTRQNFLKTNGTSYLNSQGGKLSVGATTSSDGRMAIYQTGSGDAIPVLELEQLDLSEEFIRFNATIAAGNPIDTAAIGTYYGKIRVSVNGTFKFMALYNT